MTQKIMTNGSRIECRNLGVGVARGPRLATVDAVMHAGRFTAILGPNGAGKSTLLSMLVGERAAQCGDVLLDDEPLASYAPQALARRRAVMPQDCSVAFDFTTREVVELGRYPHRLAPEQGEDAIATQAMRLAGVEHLAERSVNTLSGGERARAHLARALAQVWSPVADAGARWLLLDEPTAALDLAHQHHCMALLRARAVEHGVGVVAVVHDVNLAIRYAHDVLILGRGDCLSGQTDRVLVPESIQHIWGVQCTRVPAADGVPQFLFSGA